MMYTQRLEVYLERGDCRIACNENNNAKYLINRTAICRFSDASFEFLALHKGIYSDFVTAIQRKLGRMKTSR